jgi:hypothetical protein
MFMNFLEQLVYGSLAVYALKAVSLDISISRAEAVAGESGHTITIKT